MKLTMNDNEIRQAMITWLKSQISFKDEDVSIIIRAGRKGNGLTASIEIDIPDTNSNNVKTELDNYKAKEVVQEDITNTPNSLPLEKAIEEASGTASEASTEKKLILSVDDVIITEGITEEATDESEALLRDNLDNLDHIPDNNDSTDSIFS